MNLIRTALLLALLCSVLAANPRTSAQAPASDLIDWVFVTEDNAARIDGCDAISIADVNTGTFAYRGKTQVSPGRLTASRSFEYVIATYVNDEHSLYVLKARDEERSSWRKERIEHQALAPTSTVAVVEEEGILLLSSYNSSAPWNRRYPDGPYHLWKYRLDEAVGERLGPPRGSLQIDGPAMQILLADDDRRAHIVTMESTVVTIEIATMKEVAPRIRMPKLIAGSSLGRDIAPRIHAELSPDERHLIANRWLGGQLVVADLAARTSRLVETGAPISGDIAINRGWINPGLLALHARSTIRAYQFDPTGPLTEVARIAIPAPDIPQCRDAGGCTGPYASIAWSGRGDKIIAASVEGHNEFAVLDVDASTGSIDIVRRLNACPHPDIHAFNVPNDVLTANGMFIPTPTHTATPLLATQMPPSATPTPTPATTDSTTSPTPSQPRPTSSPTPSTAPTNTPRPETSTATASPIPIRSPTATADPEPLFMPLVLAETCPPRGVYLDVILVLDASTSMNETTSDGRRKLEVAKEAADAFLDGLRLEAGHDQAAIVTFNSTAQTVQRLTSDRTRLDLALGRIAGAAGSRVDLGVERAITETLSRGRSGHVHAMIVLSDGRVNHVSRERPAEVAQLAHHAGLEVYVVGMGPNLDEQVLRNMAREPDRYVPAPEPSWLRKIYTDLTTRVPCPSPLYWGRR